MVSSYAVQQTHTNTRMYLVAFRRTQYCRICWLRLQYNRVTETRFYRILPFYRCLRWCGSDRLVLRGAMIWTFGRDYFHSRGWESYRWCRCWASTRRSYVTPGRGTCKPSWRQATRSTRRIMSCPSHQPTCKDLNTTTLQVTIRTTDRWCIKRWKFTAASDITVYNLIHITRTSRRPMT